MKQVWVTAIDPLVDLHTIAFRFDVMFLDEEDFWRSIDFCKWTAGWLFTLKDKLEEIHVLLPHKKPSYVASIATMFVRLFSTLFRLWYELSRDVASSSRYQFTFKRKTLSPLRHKFRPITSWTNPHKVTVWSKPHKSSCSVILVYPTPPLPDPSKPVSHSASSPIRQLPGIPSITARIHLLYKLPCTPSFPPKLLR